MSDTIFHLKKSLVPGQAIGYWQLGAIAEERFDVPDQPMKGEMDPFFFLTKHKNFIPHEYPCRTIFAETYRGKRPDVRGAFEATRTAIPKRYPRSRPTSMLLSFRLAVRKMFWSPSSISASGTPRRRRLRHRKA